MSLLQGGAIGLFAGLSAWLVSRWLVPHYKPTEHNGHGRPQEERVRHLRLELASRPALVTIIGASLFGMYFSYSWSHSWRDLLQFWVPATLLLLISLIDLETRRIPNVLVLCLLLWAIAQPTWSDQPNLKAVAVGCLVGGGIYLILALIGRGAMGAGDVKLAAAVGATLGYPLILYGIFWGIFAGGIGAILLLVSRKAGRKDFMSYGPFIAVGFCLAWIIHAKFCS